MEARIAETIKLMQKNCRIAELTEDDFYDVCYEPIKAELPFSASTDQGVSKGVILIEGATEVIKIPFTGAYDEDAYSDHMCTYDEQQEALDRGEEIAEEDILAYPEYENFFYPFEYANSPELELTEHWNYCALECAIYDAATKEGLDEYFAREYFAGKIGDHPVYVQARAMMFEDSNSSSTRTEAELNRARTSRDKAVSPIHNPFWIADFVDCYGEDEFIRLNKFLHKHALRDFHDGNIGYINGIPVLVDYSSFSENM